MVLKKGKPLHVSGQFDSAVVRECMFVYIDLVYSVLCLCRSKAGKTIKYISGELNYPYFYWYYNVMTANWCESWYFCTNCQKHAGGSVLRHRETSLTLTCFFIILHVRFHIFLEHNITKYLTPICFRVNITLFTKAYISKHLLYRFIFQDNIFKLSVSYNNSMSFDF